MINISEYTFKSTAETPAPALCYDNIWGTDHLFHFSFSLQLYGMCGKDHKNMSPLHRNTIENLDTIWYKTVKFKLLQQIDEEIYSI